MKVRWSTLGAIWLLVCLFILLVVASSLAFTRERTRQDVQLASRQAEQISRSVEAILNRNLLGLDLSLAGLEEMGGLLRPDGRGVDPEQARSTLRAASRQNLLVDNMHLFNAQGLVASSQQALRTELPPGFLESLRAQVAPHLAMSPPTVDFSTGERVIHFGRPIALPNVKDLVVVATVPVAVLASLLELNSGGEGVSISVERDDGVLLASFPPNHPRIGEKLSQSLLHLHGSRGLGPAFLAPGRLAEGSVYLSARSLVYPAMMVSASISQPVALASSDTDRHRIARVATAFILIACVAGGLIQAFVMRLAKANAQIVHSKTVLDEALASIDEGFLLCDGEDRVIACNERYLAFFPHLRGIVAPGVPFRSLAEAGVKAVLPDADPQARSAWIQERIDLHRQANRKVEMVLADGRVIQSSSRRMANGMTVAVYHDMTQIRASEDALRDAKTAAEAASEAKTRFLATMSHEIRTPLNGVLGMNGLLLDTPLNEEQRRYAETVRASGESLLRVINDILDLSRLQVGRMSLESVVFSPADVIAEVANLLGPGAARKGLALHVDDTASLPRVKGDMGRMRQILLNLVGNAIKFTQQGHVRIRSSHRQIEDGLTELIVTVQDSGIGIAPAAMAMLYEPFTQADSSMSRRFGGSGLGLAISRQLATLMGGSLNATSEPGRGSSFELILPFETAAEAAASPLPVQQQAGLGEAPSASSRSLRILVAEDDLVNQVVIKGLLDKLHHVVDVVQDGSEALRRVQQAPYDLVLMDIQMPGMDGEAAARAIRALPDPVGSVPIIALTANLMREQLEAYRAAGMDGHLGKPLDFLRLQRVIAEVVPDAAARTRQPG